MAILITTHIKKVSNLLPILFYGLLHTNCKSKRDELKH